MDDGVANEIGKEKTRKEWLRSFSVAWNGVRGDVEENKGFLGSLKYNITHPITDKREFGGEENEKKILNAIENVNTFYGAMDDAVASQFTDIASLKQACEGIQGLNDTHKQLREAGISENIIFSLSDAGVIVSGMAKSLMSNVSSRPIATVISCLEKIDVAPEKGSGAGSGGKALTAQERFPANRNAPILPKNLLDREKGSNSWEL